MIIDAYPEISLNKIAKRDIGPVYEIQRIINRLENEGFIERDHVVRIDRHRFGKSDVGWKTTMKKIPIF